MRHMFNGNWCLAAGLRSDLLARRKLVPMIMKVVPIKPHRLIDVAVLAEYLHVG